MNLQRFAFQKWKKLVSSLPFLKKRQSEPEPSVVAPEPDNKPEEKRRFTLTEGLLIALISVSVTSLSSVIVAFLTSPDKLQIWLNFNKPDPFSCEGITMKIPRDWQQLGCKSVAQDSDATIIPKSFVSKESDPPKIRLIVEDPYEPDINLQKFYTREKEQAKLFIIGKKNNDFRDKKFDFKTNPAYELIYDYKLVYDADNIKRRDIGFLSNRKQYTIRYEANIQNFDKYEKKAGEIINSLEFDPIKEAK
jgi:hypothetical protein